MISNFLRTLVITCGVMIAASHAAQAQQAAASEPPSTFDGYRAMAITAGVIGGGLVAVIVTDGLVIPVYAWATGAEAGGMFAGVNLPTVGGAFRSLGEWGTRFARGARYRMGDTIRVFGAVSGGLLADSWYPSK